VKERYEGMKNGKGRSKQEVKKILRREKNR
jgi:hypothetical protein